jgi:hypothetical protein
MSLTQSPHPCDGGFVYAGYGAKDDVKTTRRVFDKPE